MQLRVSTARSDWLAFPFFKCRSKLTVFRFLDSVSPLVSPWDDGKLTRACVGE